MQNKHFIGLELGLLSMAFMLVGCSPPHTNPFDPDAPNYVPPTGSTAPSEISTRVRSLHTSHNITSQDTYIVLAEAWTTGQDPIHASGVAYRDWPSLNLRLTPQGLWAARLTSSYFNDATLESVIGQPFSFTISTNSDSLYTRTPVFLFRVMEATPVLHSPKDGDPTGARPELVWEPFHASFVFSYSVSVIRTEQIYEFLIWTSDSLPSSQSNITVPDSLDDGDYYWTLTVFDPFANGSQSKEGEFTVNAGAGR